MLMTLDGPAVSEKSRFLPQLFGPRKSTAITFSLEIADDEKNLKICLFVLTEYTNVTDERTHGTARRHHATKTTTSPCALCRHSLGVITIPYNTIQFIK